jgi:hypothetical protein
VLAMIGFISFILMLLCSITMIWASFIEERANKNLTADLNEQLKNEFGGLNYWYFAIYGFVVLAAILAIVFFELPILKVSSILFFVLALHGTLVLFRNYYELTEFTLPRDYLNRIFVSYCIKIIGLFCLFLGGGFLKLLFMGDVV